MLLTIGLIILAFWILGLLIHIAAAIVNGLLVFGAVLVIMHFVSKYRRPKT